MKKLLLVLAGLLISSIAHAQVPVQLCTNMTSGGQTTCAPISASNPFPVSVGTSSITGTFLVANGGTGSTSQTTNGVAYYNGTAITTGTSFVFTGTNIGIGTSTPISALAVNGVSTYYGTAPTCGTGCASVSANASNTHGNMTSNSSVSSVTLNFATTGVGVWSIPPDCVVSDSSTTAIADISAISTAALTVSFASALTAAKIYWHCSQ